MVWNTRYIGLLTYAGLAAIYLVQKAADLTVEQVGILLGPLALFISADIIKHRNDVK